MTINVVRTSVLHPVACINLANTVLSANNKTVYFCGIYNYVSRSQWPRDLIRHSVATRLLRLWVRIPSEHGCLSFWVLFLSDRGLCVRMVTPPEEFYQMWCVQLVWSRNLKNKVAMARVGPQCHMGAGGKDYVNALHHRHYPWAKSVRKTSIFLRHNMASQPKRYLSS